MTEHQEKLFSTLATCAAAGFMLSRFFPFWLLAVLFAISIAAFVAAMKIQATDLKIKQAACAAAFVLSLACTIQMGVSRFSGTPLLPVQPAQAAVAPAKDPNDPEVLASRFEINTMAGCALRGSDTSDTDYLGESVLTWKNEGDTITYFAMASGTRIGTTSIGGVSETQAFDSSQVMCSDMKVVKNPVGQWERSSSAYGQCQRTFRTKVDKRIWKDKDGSYVDASKTVIIPADAKRLSGCVFVKR